MTPEQDAVRIRLQKRVACPHCWAEFAPEDSLWIAQHSDLMGDPRLGEDHAVRFLPTRFNVKGEAIDSRGLPTAELACPTCHLPVPRALFELPTVFWSILGSPSSGKSYFLASMTWTLRHRMPHSFDISFTDVDPLCNRVLNGYEELLFLNDDKSKLVAIEKTQVQGGDLYADVRYGDRVVSYPNPFMFIARPMPSHPRHDGRRGGRVLCLYDNAGESFQPGRDSADSPATRHIARSRALFFIFDPTQDQRFREACKPYSSDPQLGAVPRSERQLVILQEAANRVRRFTGLPEYERHDRPLLIVVNKYDVWHKLLGDGSLRSAVVRTSEGRCALDVPYIQQVSAQVRDMLWRFSPDLVSSAESFAHEVLFFPVSATGTSPELMPGTANRLGVRGQNLNPVWADTPMLYALAQLVKIGMSTVLPTPTGHGGGG